MSKNSLLKLLCVAQVFLFSSFSIFVTGQSISTFENLTLPTNSTWNGDDLSGGFQSGASYFVNNYSSQYFSWDGFAYSNKQDTVTSGYTNQYSSYAGSGFNNSQNYAVGYCYPVTKIKISNNSHPKMVQGVSVSNNTYTALSMRDGDAYSKKFGGVSGNDPDWFKLSIYGYNNGLHTDTVDFYLADFRFANNDSDYIVKDWRWVDLTSIGNADSLEFALSSSDNGTWGMNTPAYFCIDNFTLDYLPENETGLDSIFLGQCIPFSFNLDTFFIDLDTPDSILYYEIIYNSDPGIFSANILNNILNIEMACPTKNINYIYNETLILRAHSLYGYTDLEYLFSFDVAGNINTINLNPIQIFPNPTSDFIEIQNAGESKIQIRNISGETIWTGINRSGDKINVSQLAQGMYFISVHNRIYKFTKN